MVSLCFFYDFNKLIIVLFICLYRIRLIYNLFMIFESFLFILYNIFCCLLREGLIKKIFIFRFFCDVYGCIFMVNKKK